MWRGVVVHCSGIVCGIATLICVVVMLPKGNWPRGKEAEQGRLRVLVTDIGNVPLQSQTKRDIAIKNNSLIPWTVAGIQSDCGLRRVQGAARKD